MCAAFIGCRRPERAKPMQQRNHAPGRWPPKLPEVSLMRYVAPGMVLLFLLAPSIAFSNAELVGSWQYEDAQLNIVADFLTDGTFRQVTIRASGPADLFRSVPTERPVSKSPGGRRPGGRAGRLPVRGPGYGRCHIRLGGYLDLEARFSPTAIPRAHQALRAPGLPGRHRSGVN